MFLERLVDAGMVVHGDSTEVSEQVQKIAGTVVDVLPKMKASMLVSAQQGTLTLMWITRTAAFTVVINPDVTVRILAVNEDVQTMHTCDGESSELHDCLIAGLEVYNRATYHRTAISNCK
jgi:hypothetical protein